MKKYDYLFLKNSLISSNILSLFVSIEKIQATVLRNEEIYPKVFDKIQAIANLQSVKYSNLLDRIEISDLRLESIINNGENSLNDNESQINGYNKALNDIRLKKEKYTFNSYNIRNFHHLLFSNTEHNHAGDLKEEDNMLLEVLDDGSKRVLFNPVSYKNTTKALNQLIDAYKIARDDESIPKLLLIPCVILDFLLIYPFSDGNERISRLLSLLLLKNFNYNVGDFVSLEKQIFKNKTEYYEAIRKSSINWDENTNDYNPFIENFLESLYSCYIELNSRFKIVNGEKKSKKFRIEETIKRSFEPISRKEIHLVWPDIAQETIKKVIKNLLNENKIKKIGNFKDARYKRNWYGSTTQNDENVVIF